MDDVFREFNETDWRTFYTFSALSAFESFWKEIERMVSSDASIEEMLNGPKWKPTTHEEIAEYLGDKRTARCLHDEVITPTFRYASVVTLFATFERELKRFVDNAEKERQAPISHKDLKGGLLEQASKYTEAFCGFSLSTLPGYVCILDLQKVRNCVVHCLGDPDLVPEAQRTKLLKLHCPAKGLDISEGAQIEIGPVFIESSLSAIRGFFRALFTQLGWKINDRSQSGPAVGPTGKS
jgi:hypothetical protein